MKNLTNEMRLTCEVLVP